MFYHRLPAVTTDPNRLEEQAKSTLASTAYNYVAGGAGERATMDANRLAFRQWKMVNLDPFKYLRELKLTVECRSLECCDRPHIEICELIFSVKNMVSGTEDFGRIPGNQLLTRQSYSDGTYWCAVYLPRRQGNRSLGSLCWDWCSIYPQHCFFVF